MPPSQPPNPKLRTPHFDPWNSSSTGHQRAENRLAGSTSWRDSRTFKLAAQFSDTAGRGGERLFDLVGAGSERFGEDGRLENGGWERGAEGLRVKEGCRDLKTMMMTKGVEPFGSDDGGGGGDAVHGNEERRKERVPDLKRKREDGLEDGREISSRYGLKKEEEDKEQSQPEIEPQKPKQIFTGCTIYINGSTYPHISDHKLKLLLVQHGARLSLALARRSVTHVIVGKPNTPQSHHAHKTKQIPTGEDDRRSNSNIASNGVERKGGGAGGGLSLRKIHKESTTLNLGRRGSSSSSCGIKYVSVEWVLACLDAGKRVSEARYSGVDTMPCSVGRSVLGFFERQHRIKKKKEST